MPAKRTTPRMPNRQLLASPPRRQASPADPCAMVIFGAGGDLTRRLVMPALYNLSRTQILPKNFAVIGVDLAEGTAESWRDHLYKNAEKLRRQSRCGVRHRRDRELCAKVGDGLTG
jgi:glucose-6-phosphate 1-dehydrogenase